MGQQGGDGVAETTARANYSTHHTSEIEYEVDTKVDRKNRRVTVEITQDHYPYFYSSVFPSPQIVASATATAAGSTNICVIGLDNTRARTVGLNDDSLLTAPNCAVYSNSQATDGLAAVKKSSLNAELACSAGGYLGMAANFSSAPLTDCPAIDDPLAKRPTPGVAPCRETALEIEGKAGSQRLVPGTYCGGLTIKANASVTLDPGIYVIKDGPLTLSSNASLFGRGVGFYFVGPDRPSAWKADRPSIWRLPRAVRWRDCCSFRTGHRLKRTSFCAATRRPICWARSICPTAISSSIPMPRSPMPLPTRRLSRAA